MRDSSQEGATAPPPGVVADLRHPQDVLRTINLVSQILSITFVTVFVMLRIYTKVIVAPPFQIDDWTCVLAWVWLSSARQTLGGAYLRADTIPRIQLDCTCEVFGTFKRTMYATYTVMIVMIGYYLPVLIIKILICRPIAAFWDPTIKAECFNQRAIFVADTAISAVTDLAVLMLPIPAAVSLRMPWAKRLRVMAILGAGGIATAASIVRMVLVVRLQQSDDETVDFIRFNLLGTAEVGIGMVCTCLPAVNILLMRTSCLQSQDRESTRVGARVQLKFLKGSKLQTQRLTTMGGQTTLLEGSNANSENGLLLARRPQTTQGDAETVPGSQAFGSTYPEAIPPPITHPLSPEWARGVLGGV
ncbi:hypothetical protein ACJZ2D_009161 [Fusarium nematophilum]